jgi:hypothetical protein
MPDTRPGIKFNEDGVCYPCLNAEKKKEVDWALRSLELAELCDKHRKNDGSYDCIIPISGGKDSHVQVWKMKVMNDMHPLLVNVANYSNTRTGVENFQNIQDRFECDCISLQLNHTTAKKQTREDFEELGSPTRYWDAHIYLYPLREAERRKIPLVIYGENISYEYGGVDEDETPSAVNQINNGVVSGLEHEQPIEGVKPIYLSYYMKWSGWDNMIKAKTLGFKSLGDTGEWRREGYIEDYDQIDAIGYLVHPWMKYPKYGHARTTDVASSLIREGKMSRDYAIQLVKENDWRLDSHAFNDFLSFTGYKKDEFWNIVNGFFNKDLFDWTGTRWLLKEPIWEQ